jgi:hypothetical protein
MWPALAGTVGIETRLDPPMILAGYPADHSGRWDRIVDKYGLRPLSLRELVGHGDQHADFAFAYGAPAGPQALVSTIKLRQAGSPKLLIPSMHSATPRSRSSTTTSCHPQQVDAALTYPSACR